VALTPPVASTAHAEHARVQRAAAHAALPRRSIVLRPIPTMDRRFLLRSHAAEVLPFASSDDEPTSSSDWDLEFDTSPSTPASSLSGPAAPPSSTLSSSSLGSAPWDEPAGGRAAVCQSRDVSSRLKGSATAQVDVEVRSCAPL
jgi:hypothetical protein